MNYRNIILLGAVAVVSYDTLGSLGALLFGFPYANVYTITGALVLYTAVGFFAARAKNRWFGLMAGIIVGVVDATLGWSVSWMLGPGRLPVGTITTTQLLVGGLTAVVLATIFAGLGGIAGGFFRTRSPN